MMISCHVVALHIIYYLWEANTDDLLIPINALRPWGDGRHFADVVFKSMNENLRIVNKMSDQDELRIKITIN